MNKLKFLHVISLLQITVSFDVEDFFYARSIEIWLECFKYASPMHLFSPVETKVWNRCWHTKQIPNKNESSFPCSGNYDLLTEFSDQRPNEFEFLVPHHYYFIPDRKITWHNLNLFNIFIYSEIYPLSTVFEKFNLMIIDQLKICWKTCE